MKNVNGDSPALPQRPAQRLQAVQIVHGTMLVDVRQERAQHGLR
jgi:hypothetical protein